MQKFKTPKRGSIDGIIVEALAEGEKIPIIYLHGLWGTVRQLRDWMNRSNEEGHPCYSVELPGRNGSGPTTSADNISFEEMVEAVEKVLKDVGPAVLVGQGLGGLIAQAIVDQAPELVTKVVLVASEPPKGIPVRGQVFLRICRLKPCGKWFGYIRAICSGKAFEIDKKDIGGFLVKKSEVTPEIEKTFTAESGLVGWQIALGSLSLIKGIPIRDDLSLERPMLVINGEEDKAVPIGINKSIADKHGALMVSYPGSGYMMMLESGWRQPIQDILTWIEIPERKSENVFV